MYSLLIPKYFLISRCKITHLTPWYNFWDFALQPLFEVQRHLYAFGASTIIRGAILIDINSWNNNLHAYGIRIWEIWNVKIVNYEKIRFQTVKQRSCRPRGQDENVRSSVYTLQLLRFIELSRALILNFVWGDAY